MKKIKTIVTFLMLMVLFSSLPVCAAENSINSGTISESEVTPRALITASNVRKRSNNGNFVVEADIVTNDGTGKIIDIKNISLEGWPGSVNEGQVSLSNGEIWNNGEYAIVNISYWYEGKYYTDYVMYYPYGK